MVLYQSDDPDMVTHGGYMADEQQIPEEVVTQEPDAPQPEVVEAEPEPTGEPEVDWKSHAERLEQQ